MDRYLTEIIKKDLTKKMVFIAGPRQVGKTTLAVKLLEGQNQAYLNYDVPDSRELILKRKLPKNKLLVFDELHKYLDWRNYLKGIYDDLKRDFQILVTGSARLDFYRAGGDSLQGRYNLFRLHPLSVAELNLKTKEEFSTLLELGGFPEPYFSNSKEEALRWVRQYRSRVVMEDIRDLEMIQDLGKLEMLLLILPDLVGSPLSINGVRENLQVAHLTIERWIQAFERLYHIFRIAPLTTSKVKSLKKSQKCYFYNWGAIGDPAKRFENLVASHLLKWVHYQQDVHGKNIELYFLRDRTGKEVDFVLTEGKKVLTLIECKLKEQNIDLNLKYYATKFPEAQVLQLVQEMEETSAYVSSGITVQSALSFLKTLI